jgi:NIMA (never in mitosis gene a)-related kinase
MPPPLWMQSASANPQSYTVVQELGKGGSGKAFLVRGKTDGLFHVAKQIVCIGDRYSAAKASYALHETRLLFVLRHPHVVELRDFYPKSSNYFIVMEFCEQGDLARHIEHAIMQGRALFSVERVYSWWYQILDAVDFCHNKGVIHRDLKPRNVFLDRNLDVKIGDFGVAALVSFPPAVEIVGTATYHAPEVRSALNYSARSDIWAVGCIMWDAMTLRPAGGEPLSLQALNLQLIDAYGPPARELLVSHLQVPAPPQLPASALPTHGFTSDRAGGMRAGMRSLTSSAALSGGP